MAKPEPTVTRFFLMDPMDFDPETDSAMGVERPNGMYGVCDEKEGVVAYTADLEMAQDIMWMLRAKHREL